VTGVQTCALPIYNRFTGVRQLPCLIASGREATHQLNEVEVRDAIRHASLPDDGDRFERGEFDAQLLAAGGCAIHRDDVGEDVELAGIGHAFDPTSRHRVANLGEQLVEGVVLPVREEAVALERGRPLGSNELVVMATAAARLERRLAAGGLCLRVDAVPDLATATLL